MNISEELTRMRRANPIKFNEAIHSRLNGKERFIVLYRSTLNDTYSIKSHAEIGSMMVEEMSEAEVRMAEAKVYKELLLELR